MIITYKEIKQYYNVFVLKRWLYRSGWVRVGCKDIGECMMDEGV